MQQSGSRLCHSCKTIKPLRASHCKQCNRCVLAFDHHCPYVQNCVGYKNRVPFFIFVASFTVIEWITCYMAYMILQKEPFLYWLWPGAVLIVLYCGMVTFLLFGAVSATSSLVFWKVLQALQFVFIQLMMTVFLSMTFRMCFTMVCNFFVHL